MVDGKIIPEQSKILRKLVVEFAERTHKELEDLRKRIAELERWKRETLLRSAPGIDD